ncbi:hypothetical protein [Jiella marina]|uniref:hypothetical protein n=1 Tax=Jiella sp. LLJ827 TaxID=2917712 RepID=UPI002100DAAD|nr:hypothetical protein [Jiella sp. LLJ827]MCQ0987740.1 hypothetical protein [Jiella sp. LLJ827]
MTTLPGVRSTPQDMNAGAIIGRADLSDDVLLDGLRTRLASKRRPATEAEEVLQAALAGEQEAIGLLRTIPVPAPSARLSMPEQKLSRPSLRRAIPLPVIRISWTRG